jgi:hypothetical protein
VGLRWRRRRGFAAAGSGGSSGNHVNVTSAMVSTQVWPGRKRARRGMCLGARVCEMGAGEGHTAAARGTVATTSNHACGKTGRKGKRCR